MWSDHQGNRDATVPLMSFPWLSRPFTTAFYMVSTCRGRHATQRVPQCENVTCFYLLGLSLRLVLLARKELCSWLSSNGSRALERRPCWKGEIKAIFSHICDVGHGNVTAGKIVVWLNYQTGGDRTNRYLCDILNKVLPEGESAAYEPHGNNMMGQWYDILVESRQKAKEKWSDRVCPFRNACVWSTGTYLEGLV